MGSFTSWEAMALDALIHGAEFTVALGGVGLVIGYGVGKLAELFQKLV